MEANQRFFCQLLIVVNLLMINLTAANLHPTEAAINKNIDRNTDLTASYNEIIKDLREHWQSPIMYLKKRGYLPDLKTVLEPKAKLSSDTEDLAKQFISNSKNKINLISSIIDENEKFEDVDDLANGQLLADIRDKFASLFPAAATNEKLNVVNADMNSADSYSVDQLNHQLAKNAAQFATNTLNQALEEYNLVKNYEKKLPSESPKL